MSASSIPMVNIGSNLGWILILGGLLAIGLSFAMRGRRTAGYSTTRESHVDPGTGTRVDRTDVDPR